MAKDSKDIDWKKVEDIHVRFELISHLANHEKLITSEQAMIYFQNMSDELAEEMGVDTVPMTP